MEQRHEEDYTEFFNVIRHCIEQETGGGLGVMRFFMGDYERAAHNASTAVFGLEQKYCVFHFVQVSLLTNLSLNHPNADGH